MTKQLNLKVGKRYETRDGRVAFVSTERDDGDFLGVAVPSETRLVWEKCGLSRHSDTLDLIRCLDDEPELVDLTTIDQPFSELDERTRGRLLDAWLSGRGVERHRPSGWHDYTLKDRWLRHWVVRLKPDYEPMTIPDDVWRAVPGVQWIAADKAGDIWAYNKTPIVDETCWSTGDQAFCLSTRLFCSINRGTVPWDQSLTKRPEGL